MNASQTLEAGTNDTSRNCPAWCVATHRDNDSVHLQEDAVFTDTYGKCIEVSAFAVEGGTSGIYLGSREVSPEQARAIAQRLIECADLVA